MDEKTRKQFGLMVNAIRRGAASEASMPGDGGYFYVPDEIRAKLLAYSKHIWRAVHRRQRIAVKRRMGRARW